jgi:hypothetical protein
MGMDAGDSGIEAGRHSRIALASSACSDNTNSLTPNRELNGVIMPPASSAETVDSIP